MSARSPWRTPWLVMLAMAIFFGAVRAKAQTLPQLVSVLVSNGTKRVINAEVHTDPGIGKVITQILAGSPPTREFWFEFPVASGPLTADYLKQQVDMPGTWMDKVTRNEALDLADVIVAQAQLRGTTVRPLLFYKWGRETPEFNVESFLGSPSFAVASMGSAHAVSQYHCAYGFAWISQPYTARPPVPVWMLRLMEGLIPYPQDFDVFMQSQAMGHFPAMVRLNTSMWTPGFFASLLPGAGDEQTASTAYFLGLGFPIARLPVWQGVEADVIFPPQALPKVVNYFKKAKPNRLGKATLICTGIAGCPG